jgi:hypothetical protein
MHLRPSNFGPPPGPALFGSVPFARFEQCSRELLVPAIPFWLCPAPLAVYFKLRFLFSSLFARATSMLARNFRFTALLHNRSTIRK